MTYTPIQKVDNIPSFMESSDGVLKVEFKSWSEPNFGRMLWQVDILLKSKEINDILFSNGWNYINFRIDKLQLNDSGRQVEQYLR